MRSMNNKMKDLKMINRFRSGSSALDGSTVPCRIASYVQK